MLQINNHIKGEIKRPGEVTLENKAVYEILGTALSVISEGARDKTQK